jgi:antitoxin ParD1/3/4
MGTMNISLPDDLIAFVRDAADGDGYGNNSDVVRDALRLLRAQRAQRSALQNLVAKGIAQLDAGEGVPLTSEVLRSVADRAKKRAAAKREAGS